MILSMMGLIFFDEKMICDISLSKVLKTHKAIPRKK
jgi:hypothetical protein